MQNIKKFIIKHKKKFIFFLCLWLSYVLLIAITMIYGLIAIQPEKEAIEHQVAVTNPGFEFNLGISNVNLIKAKNGYLLIDTGDHAREEAFDTMLKDVGVEKKDIKYILITHHHHDHAGLINDLRKESDAQLILHENARQYLEQGETNENALHAATLRSGFLMFAFKHGGGHEAKFEPIEFQDQDIFITNDDRELLRNIGVEGDIIVTPGHSDDSISVIMDDGRAFVGDNAENWFTFTGTCKQPMHITNEEELKESWETIIDEGAQTIYSGHGPSFQVDELKNCLNKFN